MVWPRLARYPTVNQLKLCTITTTSMQSSQFIRPQKFTVALKDKTQLNETFAQYRFELISPNHLTFIPGQYVSLKVNDAGARRSYSIVSSPAIAHGFELLVEHIPDGVGSQFLQALELGGEVEVLAPLGMFVLDQTEQEYVFVATGSGVAPFRSMILQLLQQEQSEKPITLYFGIRHATDLVWQQEFQELSTLFPNFRFHPTISQAPTEWPLCRGRVTDCLQVHDISLTAGYYLCGGASMITDVKALLQKRGIAQTQIHHEKFF